MANTVTPRLGMTLYGDRTVDGPTMVIENSATTILDGAVVMGGEGPLLGRPATPNKGHRLYLATDTGVLYWDNGSGWVVIGSNISGSVTITGLPGQSGDMLVVTDSSANVLARITATGVFTGHFTDTNVWTSPTLATGWNNAAGYYNGPQYLKSGDWVQVRGQVIASGGASALLAVLPALIAPRDSQKFPVQDVTAGAYGSVAARLIGNQDAGGGTPGALYLDNFVVGRTYDINLPYIVHA